MTEDIKLRAVEPFVSGNQKGTGLGLSIVSNIVRRWGGEIEIVSALGTGTRVIISIAAPASTSSVE
jgi:signal transduction histidine kinase